MYYTEYSLPLLLLYYFFSSLLCSAFFSRGEISPYHYKISESRLISILLTSLYCACANVSQRLVAALFSSFHSHSTSQPGSVWPFRRTCVNANEIVENENSNVLIDLCFSSRFSRSSIDICSSAKTSKYIFREGSCLAVTFFLTFSRRRIRSRFQ